MPSNDNHQQDTSNTPGEVLNNNHGPGTFNQANGTQNINVYHCSHAAGYQGGAVEGDAISECHDGRAASDTRPIRRLHHGRELEPYQSIIDSISRISQHVQSFSPLFPRNSTIAGICNEADEIALLIRCVARTIRQIEQVSSTLLSHSVFSCISRYAFKYIASSKDLEKCLDKHKPHQHPPPTSTMSAGPWRLFLQVLWPSQHGPRAGSKPGDMTPCGWPSLSQGLKHHFHLCRSEMMQFPRILVA
ncbi:hypothetical protein BDN71DRAFT_725155 [Pleurotus eryngii]|uniref:Uncharacterized protein n=1 Tax=Pleurotus eryngii TaxID=5323 RepID=A0A9P6A9E5_PLEER|nr:hypothetical protein BDN71DRAFT_725155 [Pleurotus eryngii]